MAERRNAPNDPLGFIRQCIRDGDVYWTYHGKSRGSRLNY